MNIIDAVKSGKKIRRPSFGWGWIYLRSEGYTFSLNRQDILADDWEIEEKKVEITYERLKEAFESASPSYQPYSSQLGVPIVSYPSVEVVAKELGLLDD